jgi:hypothetical protein
MNQESRTPIPIWKLAKTDCHFQEWDSKELSLIECFFLLFLVPLLSSPQAWLLPLSPRWARMSLLMWWGAVPGLALMLRLGEYLWWLWSRWPTGLWLQHKLWLTHLQYLQERENHTHITVFSHGVLTHKQMPTEICKVGFRTLPIISIPLSPWPPYQQQGGDHPGEAVQYRQA